MASEKLMKGGVEILDGAFLLKVSRDRLLAVVVPKDAKENKAIDPKGLAEALEENGISFGVLPAPEPLPDGSFCVAKGRPPVPGEDAKIKLHVKPSVVRVPKLKDPDKDRVDFRELGSIVNVAKDKLLVEKIPPTLGKAGEDVFGTGIPAKPGKDRKLKCGPGVYLSEDESKIFSKYDGKFVMADGKPAVFEEHKITGDIDLSVGNIVFGGKNLLIGGEVLPGFSVKCKGDITIRRGVNNGFVLAGGNLTVLGSVVGEETVLRAKGNVIVDFMENGPRVETAGDLIVNDYIVQCQAMVGRNLVAKGKGKGAVIGGRYIMGGSMYVKELGSDAEIATSVSVGIVPSLQEKKQKLDDDLKLWSDRMNEIIKTISTLEKMKKEQGAAFPPDKKELLGKYRTAMPKAMDKVNDLTEQVKAMEEELEKRISECVYVYGILYPGVQITIGSQSRTITTEEEQCVAYFDPSSRQILVRKMSREERAFFEAVEG